MGIPKATRPPGRRCSCHRRAIVVTTTAPQGLGEAGTIRGRLEPCTEPQARSPRRPQPPCSVVARASSLGEPAAGDREPIGQLGGVRQGRTRPRRCRPIALLGASSAAPTRRSRSPRQAVPRELVSVAPPAPAHLNRLDLASQPSSPTGSPWARPVGQRSAGSAFPHVRSRCARGEGHVADGLSGRAGAFAGRRPTRDLRGPPRRQGRRARAGPGSPPRTACGQGLWPRANARCGHGSREER
jgi:hypothetical protein